MSNFFSRRSFLQKSLLVTGAAALAACTPAAKPEEGSSSDQPATAPQDPGEKKKLVFASYTWSGYEEAMNQMIDDWTAQNPNTEVERQFAPWDDFWPKLQTMLAGGSQVDLGIADYGRVVSYAKNGTLLKINDLVNGTAFPIDKMMPAAVAHYRWNQGDFDTGAEGGDLYGIPCDAQSQVMAYNKEMFDAAGVAYPTDDWTWDDLVEAAKKLTDPAKNQWGIFLNPGLLWRGIILSSAGGAYHTPDYKKSLIDSPETIEAYQWVWDLIHTHKVAPGPAAASQTNPFLSGQVAMIIDGVWWLSDFAKGMKEGSWDVCMFPKHPRTGKRTTSVEADGWWIFKATKEPQLAWSLTEFLGNEAGQKRFGELNYMIPSCFPEVGKTWFSQTPPENRMKVLENIQQDSAKVDITYFESATIQSVVDPVIAKAFADGEDITKALQEASKLMDEELAKAWTLFQG